jgi:hypothetical protein
VENSEKMYGTAEILGEQVSFYYENWKITFYFSDLFTKRVEKIEPINIVEADNWAKRENVMFHTYLLPVVVQTIVPESKVVDFFGNYNTYINYYFRGYFPDAKYDRMNLNFPELDNLTFPGQYVERKYETDGDVVTDLGGVIIPSKYKLIKEFNFEFKGKSVRFNLGFGSTSKNNCCYTVTSFLNLYFDETNDFEWMYDLYWLIFKVFAFIFNRTNLSLNCATIHGKNYDEKVPQFQSTHCKLFVKNNREKPEELKYNIGPRFADLADHFEDMLQLFLENKIYNICIPYSKKRRNTYDTGRFLSVTAAFEFYCRMFLPSISNVKRIKFYVEVKDLIEQKYRDVSGKKKEAIGDIIDFLTDYDGKITLEQKIMKVFCGYEGWKSLREIFINNNFGKGVSNEECKKHASRMNEIRNEYAHGKNTVHFEIDEEFSNAVDATNFVEKLNYCIVLRACGYEDEIIKKFVEGLGRM